MSLSPDDYFQEVTEGELLFRVGEKDFRAVISKSIDPDELTLRAKIYKDGIYILNEKVRDHYKTDLIKTLTQTIVDKGYEL